MKKFEHFGKTIRRMRETSGLSQAELGKKIGSLGQEISNCERGIAALPKPKLAKLIKALDLNEKDCRRMIDALASDAAKYTRQDFAKALKAGG